MSTHNIRRISLEVNRTGNTNGLDLLEEASAWANETLLPQIEEVFASLPESDELIRIGRLELELNSTAGNWRHEILARLKWELTAMLLEKISTERTNLKSAEKLRPQESFFRNLVYFLQHGALPWSSTIQSKDAWDKAITVWLSSVHAADYKSRLVEVLAYPAVRFRFIQSISSSALQKAMSVFFSVPEGIWIGWVADANVIAKATGIERRAVEHLAKSLTENVFEVIADHGFTYERSFEIQVVARVLARLIKAQQISPEIFQPLQFASEGFSEARKMFIGASLTKDLGPPPAWSAADVDATDRSAPIVRIPIGNPSQDNGRARIIRESPAFAAEGIYASNAGTVLLAPFLTTFFERLGVARNRELMQPGVAMALIHYLATAQENPAEFQLVVPKILCGWDMEEPVELPEILTGEMKNEAGQLLAAVIEHWSILKNTSAEGLQQSFLQRQGKITLTESDDWVLQVEQKPFDMLLQHLPWSFQLIKLPWMNRLLRTEWVY